MNLVVLSSRESQAAFRRNQTHGALIVMAWNWQEHWVNPAAH
jgi:hypothetical protein